MSERARTRPPAVQPAPLREPDEDSLRLAEALVFASAEPVTPRGLARVLADDIDADAVLAALQARYAGRGVELVDAGNGVMFRSALDLAPRLRKVIESPRRLPRVAMETLAIVAYHQPMTRPEIEHIRGTALSQQTLDSLLELNLIAPKGRRETPGPADAVGHDAGVPGAFRPEGPARIAAAGGPAAGDGATQGGTGGHSGGSAAAVRNLPEAVAGDTPVQEQPGVLRPLLYPDLSSRPGHWTVIVTASPAGSPCVASAAIKVEPRP